MTTRISGTRFGPHRPERLVLSHQDEDTGRRYLYRAGEILVDASDVALTAGILRRARARLVGEVEGMLLFRIPQEDGVPALVKRLRRIEGHRLVTPNHVMRFALHEHWHPNSAAEPAEPLDELPPLADSPAGIGIKVGVVDTGLASHPWFQGRAKRARAGSADEEELHETRPDALDFEAGHGTHVAGIILQSAPGAEVIVHGVDDTKSHLDDVEARNAIRAMAERGVDILNLSFGGFSAEESESDDSEREESQTPLAVTKRALKDAWRRNPNLVVVAAAGNRPEHDENHEDQRWSRKFYPAAFHGVIGVAALQADEQTAASFSNRGPWVRCSTVGVGIVSTHLWWDGLAIVSPPPVDHHHHSSSDPRVEPRSFRGWARWSGTSFATPQVAGAIAAAMSPGGGTSRVSADVAVKQVIPEKNGLELPGLGVKANVTPIAGVR